MQWQNHGPSEQNERVFTHVLKVKNQLKQEHKFCLLVSIVANGIEK